MPLRFLPRLLPFDAFEPVEVVEVAELFDPNRFLDLSRGDFVDFGDFDVFVDFVFAVSFVLVRGVTDFESLDDFLSLRSFDFERGAFESSVGDDRFRFCFDPRGDRDLGEREGVRVDGSSALRALRDDEKLNAGEGGLDFIDGEGDGEVSGEVSATVS